ncbi:MAG: radical SAM protein [Candidatus Hydrothermota bacterium]|nr:MAG: radical SAM protein [Candidatus Hydrothermae bacterium]
MRDLVFGPVPSRRLGLSLGVDIIPLKTCSYNCIYCQIGRTPRPTVERKIYVEPEPILQAVKEAVERGPKPDYVTFSGSGEPTLNSALGEMIRKIKGITEIPVAVITNGSLLWMEEVRRDLSEADLVMPSLDAVSEGVFRRINRAASGLRIEAIVDGLKRFCEEFDGKIWLEIMLVDGVNTSIEELNGLKEIALSLKLDRIQLNTVVRPPAERWARAVPKTRMEEIRRFFGPKAEVIADYVGKAPKIHGAAEANILNVLRRHPCTAEEISDSLGIPIGQVNDRLRSMLRREIVREISHEGKTYFLPRE